MAKKKSNYYLRQLSGRNEQYSQQDYEELLKHEGEFRHSDFKSWNMAKLWRTAKVLRDEAFRRAEEFEKAVKEENLPLSQAYARLEERNITWVTKRTRLPFGSKKIDVINNIVQTLTFLDDKTSTVEGWKAVLKELSETTKIDYETLKDKDLSSDFFDVYYLVTDYLQKHGAIWTPSETMREVYNTINDLKAWDKLDQPDIIELVKKRLSNYYGIKYEEEVKTENEQADVNAFITTKK